MEPKNRSLLWEMSSIQLLNYSESNEGQNHIPHKNIPEDQIPNVAS